MADKAKELGLREFEDKQKATIGQVGTGFTTVLAALYVC